MAKKQTPYRMQMWAIMKDGEPHMVLPDIDQAEAHLGSLSLNGFSKHHWTIQKVDVRFPLETAAERKARLDRAVQQVVELNRAMAQGERH